MTGGLHVGVIWGHPPTHWCASGLSNGLKRPNGLNATSGVAVPAADLPNYAPLWTRLYQGGYLTAHTAVHFLPASEKPLSHSPIPAGGVGYRTSLHQTHPGVNNSNYFSFIVITSQKRGNNFLVWFWDNWITMNSLPQRSRFRSGEWHLPVMPMYIPPCSGGGSNIT